MALLADASSERPHGDLCRGLARGRHGPGSAHRARTRAVRRHAPQDLVVRGPARRQRRADRQDLAQPFQVGPEGPAAGDRVRSAHRLAHQPGGLEEPARLRPAGAARGADAGRDPPGRARRGTSSTPRTRAPGTSPVADILLSRFRIHMRAKSRARAARGRDPQADRPAAPRGPATPAFAVARQQALAGLVREEAGQVARPAEQGRARCRPGEAARSSGCSRAGTPRARAGPSAG